MKYVLFVLLWTYTTGSNGGWQLTTKEFDVFDNCKWAASTVVAQAQRTLTFGDTVKAWCVSQ